MTNTRGLRPFLLLAIAYGVSTFGNFLNLVAVNLYVLQTGGGVLDVGALMAARLAAAFAAGPVAGWLAARSSRRRLMVSCDVLQASTMVLLLTPAGAHLQTLWVSAVVLGAGNTVYQVTLRTSVPDLVGFAERQRGNGYLVTAKAFGTVLGFAAAGPLIGGFGYPAAFAVNAASFLVSAVALVRLPLSFRPGGGEVRPGEDVRPGGEVRPGGGEVRRTAAHRAAVRLRPSALLAVAPVSAALIGLRGVEGWGSASHNVVLPVLAGSAEPANPAVLLSQFWTAWAVGCLSMYQVVGRWLRRSGHRLDDRVYAGAVGLASVGFVAAFADVPRAVMVVLAILAGFADGLAELAYATTLQTAPDSRRAALFGTSAAVETLGLAVGMLCSALLLQWSAPLPVVAVFHGAVVVAAVSYLLLVGARHRAARRRHPSRPSTPRIAMIQERNGE